ncbi:MAG: metallophosphoesterase [Aquincola sp.]|nr:metallophosphoesterase [Aquincola sp.]
MSAQTPAVDAQPHALRYLCLSDLHLGAAYSLLTSSDDKDQPDPKRPSATLVAFGQALRQTVAALQAASPGSPPVTLVLLGDVLDMGLSPMGDVAAAFNCFVQALYPADGPQLFSTQVLYVPGNHDHHLWRVAQDSQYLDQLDSLPPDLIDTTALFPDKEKTPVRSELLTQLMRRQPHLADATVRIVYPNLGLFDEASGRCVLMHHGHYVDSTYTVMSSLNQAVWQTPPPQDVATIEGQNGPWVDFLWSDLGSAGTTGQSALTLYEVLRDAGASRTFTERAGEQAAQLLSRTLGISGQTQTVQGLTVEQLLRALMDVTIGRGAESERDDDLQLMSASGRQLLIDYLAGPLKRQLDEALAKVSPTAPTRLGATRFIYGHTHKPFEREFAVPGYPMPVAVYNTGGWVIDQPTMGGTQGAAAVLVDAALNVASLRLFQDPANGHMKPVQVSDVGSMRPQPNPLRDALLGAVEAQRAAWQVFSQAACAAAELQAARLLDRFFQPQQS